jgi:hypothetical protein
MKFNRKVFFILLAMIISFGCGVRKTTSTTTSTQNALISKNGVQIVSGSSNFVGNWSGYIESDFTSLTISSDGSVKLTAKGQTIQEKLVKNNQNEFFITDTKYNQLLPVDSHGANLNLYDPSGYAYSFSRN